MITVIAIAVALVAAVISYFALFKGFGDFCEGLGKFFDGQPNGKWGPWPSLYSDGGGTSGVRFFLFVFATLAAGALTYLKLYVSSH